MRTRSAARPPNRRTPKLAASSRQPPRHVALGAWPEQAPPSVGGAFSFLCHILVWCEEASVPGSKTGVSAGTGQGVLDASALGHSLPAGRSVWQSRVQHELNLHSSPQDALTCQQCTLPALPAAVGVYGLPGCHQRAKCQGL